MCNGEVKPSVFVVVVEYNKYMLSICDWYFYCGYLCSNFKLNSFSFRQKKMVKYRQRKKICLYLEKKELRKYSLPEELVVQVRQYYESSSCLLLYHFKLSCKELSLEY